jgi:uncharacterized protein YeaO (DUF488 family)
VITIARIYDFHQDNREKDNRGRYNEKTDYKILVDRLWPRALSKDKVKIDLWMKSIAPSDKLRKWFSHDPKKWEKFKSKYSEEVMKDNTKIGLLRQIKRIEKEKSSVILLYSAKDTEHNNAVALKELLSKFDG